MFDVSFAYFLTLVPEKKMPAILKHVIYSADQKIAEKIRPLVKLRDEIMILGSMLLWS